ncbi:MAG: hypothetical protein H6825_14830 [Planctomycetes bacterium]|nr:hypothetical protein [Planctomycetota bacterium]
MPPLPTDSFAPPHSTFTDTRRARDRNLDHAPGASTARAARNLTRRGTTPVALALALALACALALPAVVRAQSVPGFEVTPYASVTHPVMLSFGPDGTLYAGTDPQASGSTTADFVHSIGFGGSPVTALGNVPTDDPDTILLDVAGTISGVPGSLLVTGLITTTTGRISAIHPDGTVVTLFDSGTWANIVEMKFDLGGRLVFTAKETRSLWTSTGGTPTILATLPGSAYPTFFAVDAANRLVVGATDNKIRIYDANGVLVNPSLATVGGLAGLEVGPGGAFGTDVYLIDTVAGTLVRVDAAGTKTVVGTGFATGFGSKDIAFGPSGDLFASVNPTNTVLRITPRWDDLGCALAGVAGLPQLVGTGTLGAGSLDSVDLSAARPNALAGLFLGLSSASLAFKGGTLKPFPFFGPVFVTTSPAGTIDIPFVVGDALPGGTELVVQWAVVDAAAIYGVALSNAVRGVSP